MTIRTLLLAGLAPATLAAALVTPAHAHRAWLLPSTTTLSGTGQVVSVDAAVSNDLFHPDHVALKTDQITVEAPDGSKGLIENAATGRHRSTFDVTIDKPGTWKIGTSRTAYAGTFMLNGEEWRVGGRPPRPAKPGTPKPSTGAPPVRRVAGLADIPAGATQVKLAEVLSTNAVFVTADAPTKTVFTSGKGLELDPITHPSALVSDEEARFRFLIDGKPAGGVKVTLVPGAKKFREAEQAQELVTDAQGLLTVKWPLAGMYWLSAAASDTKPSERRAQERRMTYVTTLEVVAP
ncbi:DUF4198 domain-containing protein [Novosphingobium sp. TCA1]|uniref:DUF4198 domain-containing protein n=1 Tax=Novosphingobium sp. TCA1 TaxID=2682474 RepID=UPI0013068F79|nr:DUF4198 domain-containing protein [Novosphingobium sp. TCA1]GFE74961.1 ABC transporter permease [Novosphingobium sp. TCA1]